MKQPDRLFCQRVASHCLGERAPDPAIEHRKFFGKAFTSWDGGETLLNKFGDPQPIARGENGQFVPLTLDRKFQRITATLNEVTSYGFSAPLRLDMQDARDYGAPVKWPVVSYNRRKNTSNIVLWPLVSYHTQGERAFVHETPIDTLPFDKKSDVARWRGNLAGRTCEALAPSGGPRRFAENILQQIDAGSSDDELRLLHEELMGITRYNVVVRYLQSDKVDAFLTLPSRHKTAQKSAFLAHLCKPRVPLEWFFQSKYILSLSGTDTGSNFLMAANSNAITLKEDDGWELFYTGEFKPWEHYIPLKAGATDLDEKLAWAKANPQACKEMSKSAQAVCALFAAPQNRKLYLSLVLEGLKVGKKSYRNLDPHGVVTANDH